MFIKFTNETDEQFAARKIARAAASDAFRAANQPTAAEREIHIAAMFNLLSGNIAATSFPTK